MRPLAQPTGKLTRQTALPCTQARHTAAIPRLPFRDLPVILLGDRAISRRPLRHPYCGGVSRDPCRASVYRHVPLHHDRAAGSLAVPCPVTPQTRCWGGLSPRSTCDTTKRRLLQRGAAPAFLACVYNHSRIAKTVGSTPSASFPFSSARMFDSIRTKEGYITT